MSADTVDEAMLFAYVDEELDAAQRARVETAVARDPELAAMLARQQQLKTRLQRRFDTVLDEAVPERLLHAAAAPASAQIVELRAVREYRSARARPRWSWREWGAVAATLMIGLLIGTNLQHGAGGSLLVAGSDGLMASGALADALTGQPAGPVGAEASIGLSIRTSAGEYCRSFSLQSGSAGLACRRDNRWMVDLLETGQPASAPESFRQAGSSMPEALRAAIESRMTGEPLTEAQELEQIGRHWDAAGPQPPAELQP
jgi:hypothetical protein